MTKEFSTLGSYNFNLNTSPNEYLKGSKDTQINPVVYADDLYQEPANGLSKNGIEPTMKDYLSQINNNFSSINNQNQWSNALKTVGLGINGLATLGSIYLGFKQLHLAKESLGLAKEQWEKAKQEAERIKQVRNNITKQYLGE